VAGGRWQVADRRIERRIGWQLLACAVAVVATLPPHPGIQAACPRGINYL